jgi:diguanylate cyclase (GGDEF)-like protein
MSRRPHRFKALPSRSGLFPVGGHLLRRGRDLERFLNLWRGAILIVSMGLLLSTWVADSADPSNIKIGLVFIGSYTLLAVGFHLSLSWLPWRDRLGAWVVAADFAFVIGLMVAFVAAGRPLVATNSQVLFLGFLVVLSLAGARGDARITRGVTVAAPLSYAAVVFLAVTWWGVNLMAPDLRLGAFRWEVQAVRVLVLLVVTGMMSFDVIMGLTDRDAAQRDPLTGVYNRRFLEEFLGREVPRARRMGRPLAVLLLDLDGFKEFNDSFGHPAGDSALSEVARAIVSAVRASDVVARYGGDEFVVILPDTPGEAARHVARDLTRVGPLGITLSVGVACLGEQLTSAADLLVAADDALLQAKRAKSGVETAGVHCRE